jgi:hypothetical protein
LSAGGASGPILRVTLDVLFADAVFAVRPVKVIGLVEDDLTGSPTRSSAVN